MLELINGRPGLGNAERLVSCMMVIGDVLAGIDCPGCRRLSLLLVKRELPKVLKHAIEMGNDHAITFTVRKGEPSTVILWHGSGHPSDGWTADPRWDARVARGDFRQWVADAFEPRGAIF